MGEVSHGAGAELPFIDEHTVLVAAPVEAVWRAVARRFDPQRAGATRVLAWVLAAEPGRAHGRPLVDGSASPGFAVADAEPGHRARLAGRHRFSRYTLTFVLEPRPGGTLLRARSHAAFPGRLGRAYRQAVIGSGAHRVVMARMLRGIGRYAERHHAGG